MAEKNMHLNLLLPEGYFKTEIAGPISLRSAGQELGTCPPSDLDNALLQKTLATGKPFKNAEMLLMEYHNFHASQVEDRYI